MPAVANSQPIAKKTRTNYRYSQQPVPAAQPRRHSLSLSKAHKVNKIRAGLKSFVGEGSLDLSIEP